MPIKTVSFFDCKNYEKSYYPPQSQFDFRFFDSPLSSQTVDLCRGSEVVSCFVNDDLNWECLRVMADLGVRFVALRCTGFNNVDLHAAQKFGIKVSRVPGYSPQSVAEFALLQMLCLARKLHRSLNRTRELNFSLDGLVGHTLFKKKVGVIGTGQIGKALIELLDGFNCQILAYDLNPDESLNSDRDLQYVELEEIFRESDYVSLHVPLNPETFHMVNDDRLAMMKSSALLINTSRGGLVDTTALIDSIKTRKIAGAALDVYEEEEAYFSKDFSDQGVDDDELARLISFPNVIVTSHQAYLTELSLQQISAVTVDNLEEFFAGKPLSYEVSFEES